MTTATATVRIQMFNGLRKRWQFIARSHSPAKYFEWSTPARAPRFDQDEAAYAVKLLSGRNGFRVRTVA